MGQKNRHLGLFYAACSIAIHGVILAIFLLFSPEHSSEKKRVAILEMRLLEAPAKKIPPTTAEATITKSVQKKPRRAHPQATTNRTAAATNQANVLDINKNEYQEKSENENATAIAHINVRKIPVLLNPDEIVIPYPKRALQFMIEGVVRLRLTVSEHGLVTNIKVLSGPQFGLQNAALLVARKLIFLPATDENGHATASDIVHDVIFRLKS